MNDIEMLQIAFLANEMGICVGESEIVHNVYDQQRRYSLFLVTILDDCWEWNHLYCQFLNELVWNVIYNIKGRRMIRIQLRKLKWNHIL